MLTNSITIVTALTMLAHSVWGCCWHHAHDEHSTCAAVHFEDHAATAHGEHAGCAHVHYGVVDRSTSAPVEHGTCGHGCPEEEAPGHDGCHENRCTFVKTSSVDIAGLWAAMVALWPAAPELSVQTIVAASRAEADEAARPPLSAQAMRALTQTWLL